jgi:MoxR-like ATPase
MSNIRHIDDVSNLLSSSGYVSDENIATALFLAIRLQRPLLIEGHAGVG